MVWAASLVGCSPSELLDFSASINPLGPPDSAIAAIQASVSDLSHYPDPSYRRLRQELGKAHGLSSDWILPGNGSAELLTWLSRELAELDATYLFTPAFGDYLRALRAFDASVVPLVLKFDGEMERWGDEEIDKFPSYSPIPPLPHPPTPSGLLLNNPHNPTGQLFSIEALLPLLEQFALVAVDEAFMDFLPPDRQQSLIEQVQHYPNLVILRSLTKFYSLPGLRVGYAVAHPERLRRWQQWRDPWPVNSLAEAATLAILRDRPFQQQTWDWLAAARPQLFAGLAALPGLQPLPGAANFLLVRSAVSVLELQRRLLHRHKILIRDCISFAELGDHYFRVAVRTPPENQRLLSGLAAELAELSEPARYGG